MENRLITGRISKVLLTFTLPYLLSCFLQTFYGMADLFIVGQFNGADCLTAVSIGSQFMHFLTVMIIGLAMGITIQLGHAVGAKAYDRVSKVISSALGLFIPIACVLMIILILGVDGIIAIMQTPVEAIPQMRQYLCVCFVGIPFIIAYNIISSIFRGVGDSKSPMYFIGIACILNVLLDYVFVGGFGMKATGAALATIIAQAISSVVGFAALSKKDFGFALHIRPSLKAGKIGAIVKTGTPVAMQEGLIQISFLVITVFANGRGLIDASAVGVVEKLISFFFLVPSAFLGSLSALVSIQAGAKEFKRADNILKLALAICAAYSFLIIAVCQIIPGSFIGLFTKDPRIIASGVSYLRSYGVDTLFASMHFCFSGYFCGLGFTSISFIHNIISVIAVRIPGSYLACKLFTDTLFPMGCAAPAGSLLSIAICVGFYIYLKRKKPC